LSLSRSRSPSNAASNIRTAIQSRVCGQSSALVTTRPETSYDNFLRDFGERFVPGYRPISTVDLLINAPFKE